MIRQSRILRAPRQRGFSLIELMVAMVLGLIVVAGLINVLLANRKAFHLQESGNYTQQNMRFASDSIGYSLREAGFWGGNRASIITFTSQANNATFSSRSGCDSSWVRDVTNEIYGYSGGSAFPLSGCVPNSNYVKGSDVLVVRYSGPEGIDPAASSTIAATPSAAFVVSAVGQQAAVFKNGETVPTTPAAGAIGRYVYPYHVEMYYLQPCSDAGADGTCGTADDGDAAEPVPTLMRLRLGSSSLVAEPVVEGIEQMKVEYGVMDPANPNQIVPARYLSAAAVTSANLWPQVIAVKLGLVAVGQTPDQGVGYSGTFALTPDLAVTDANACTYSVTPTSVDTSKCVGFTPYSRGSFVAGKFVRTAFVQTVQIRNRIRNK